MAPDPFRLPTNVKPTAYDLTFKTDLDKLTFNGKGVIDLDVLDDTEEIVFNAAGIEVTDAFVSSSALKAEQVEAYDLSVESDKERIVAKLNATLPSGSPAKLHIQWEGKLTGSLKGYYYSSTLHEGKKRYYALTQFEPTAARRAFPCWDEPLLKARFTISMISRNDTVNLSNMPVTSEETLNETHLEHSSDEKDLWKLTKFQETPVMSTYLVAIANGHFDRLESSYVSPLTGQTIPLRIYATSDIIHQAAFSLEVVSKVMPIYEQSFQVAYPLPKLDTLVAHDFDMGAMENWGLMIGRTNAYLWDPKKSDIAAKKRVAGTTSHECAHSWFGNLVTMSWWDNLWLKEGFATLMGSITVTDRVFPEWKLDSDFIDGRYASALELDAMRSSHPIQVSVPDVNQINQIFDALSYAKAASVLRMLLNYVGEETFMKGISIYLSKNQYGNTVPKDLWDGVAEASGLDIPSMMDNWIYKIGYPVVTVAEKDSAIVVRQDRFLSTGDATEEENQTLWHIPLNIKTVDADGKVSLDRSIVLTEREVTIPLDTTKPFKLNGGTSGVYRVVYSPERLKLIGEEAAREGSVFSLEDRMGLLSDALYLAKAGAIPTSFALDLINSLRNDKERLVWSSIRTQLGKVGGLIWEQPDEVRDNLAAFSRSLFKPLVDRLGFEYSPEDSVDIVQLRTLAIARAAAAKETSVMEEIQSRFKHFQETGDDSRIPADLVGTIYVNAVRNGGREEYETVKKVYLNPPTPSAKNSAASAMASSKDPAIIDETLNFILNEAQFQDIIYFFAAASASRESRRKLGEFFMANYDAWAKKYEGNFSISHLVKYSFQGLTTEKDAEAVEQFFSDKDVSKYNLALHQTIDAIRANAKWLERSKDDVAEWLAKSK